MEKGTIVVIMINTVLNIYMHVMCDPRVLWLLHVSLSACEFIMALDVTSKSQINYDLHIFIDCQTQTLIQRTRSKI